MTNEDGDERQELLGQHRRSEDPNPVQFKTFKRRWLVLLLFSSLSFLQVRFPVRVELHSIEFSHFLDSRVTFSNYFLSHDNSTFDLR